MLKVSYNIPQNQGGKPSDRIITLWVPPGSFVTIAFGLTGSTSVSSTKTSCLIFLRSTESRLLLYFLKNPLVTSLIIPSPPIGIIWVEPFYRCSWASSLPSPAFSVNTIFRSLPKYFISICLMESQFFPVCPPFELRLTITTEISGMWSN